MEHPPVINEKDIEITISYKDESITFTYEEYKDLNNMNGINLLEEMIKALKIESVK